MSHMVASDGESPEKIHPLRNNEMLMLNVATATSVGHHSKRRKGQNRPQPSSPHLRRQRPTHLAFTTHRLPMETDWIRYHPLRNAPCNGCSLTHADGWPASMPTSTLKRTWKPDWTLHVGSPSQRRTVNWNDWRRPPQAEKIPPSSHVALKAARRDERRPHGPHGRRALRLRSSEHNGRR